MPATALPVPRATPARTGELVRLGSRDAYVRDPAGGSLPARIGRLIVRLARFVGRLGRRLRERLG